MANPYNKSLRSAINSAASKRPIPATVIDVLQDRCSVKLSSRGAIVKNLRFTGGTPAVGDSVFVQYGSGNPYVIVSKTTADEAASVEFTGTPVVVASKPSQPSAPIETVTKDVLYTAILQKPARMIEDLSPQIDGITDHFTISYAAIAGIIVTCNLVQSPYSILVDDDLLGFSLTYTPSVNDTLIVEYYRYESV